MNTNPCLPFVNKDLSITCTAKVSDRPTQEGRERKGSLGGQLETEPGTSRRPTGPLERDPRWTTNKFTVRSSAQLWTRSVCATDSGRRRRSRGGGVCVTESGRRWIDRGRGLGEEGLGRSPGRAPCHREDLGTGGLRGSRVVSDSHTARGVGRLRYVTSGCDGRRVFTHRAIYCSGSFSPIFVGLSTGERVKSDKSDLCTS